MLQEKLNEVNAVIAQESERHRARAAAIQELLDARKAGGSNEQLAENDRALARLRAQKVERSDLLKLGLSERQQIRSAIKEARKGERRAAVENLDGMPLDKLQQEMQIRRMLREKIDCEMEVFGAEVTRRQIVAAATSKAKKLSDEEAAAMLIELKKRLGES